MSGSAKVFALFSLFLITAFGAPVSNAMVCHPGSIGCHCTGNAGGLGGQIDLVLHSSGGGANADVSGQELNWTSFEMDGSHPVVGRFRVTLDPARTSTGHLTNPTFPTPGTMNFFWKIETGNLGTLLSVNPAVLTGTVTEMPPLNPTYTLQSPVAFYVQGDATHTTVFTLNTAKTGEQLPVPAVSPWGIGIVALFLMAGLVFLIRRRNTMTSGPIGA